MFVNTGSNLFLPEGDDYSKTEFDAKTEEVQAKGNELLNQLREQQQKEKILNTAQPPQQQENTQKKPGKSLKKQEGKMSYKEIFDSVAGKGK